MIDIKMLRNDFDLVCSKIKSRGFDISILQDFPNLDERRGILIKETEELKARRNDISKQIGVLKRNNEDVSDVMNEVNEINDKITCIDPELNDVELKINEILINLPNLPQESTPLGLTEENNVEVHRFLEPHKFSFKPKGHWDLMVELGIVDFERAAKITGSRFNVLKGIGSRLERALVNFMIDMHINEGYIEVTPPHIVNGNSLFGTGNLPKFSEDLFKLEGEDNYYLIPTAEVPVTNLYSNEILKNDVLPIKHVAQSQCYRSEAGSAGRDTRGLIRQHQFTKVEIVQFVKPEDSYLEHELLTRSAESILEALKLPYRRIVLCTGDMGFSSSKTFDIEVWLPSYNDYKEISSCSNFLDFQARRTNIKFKRDKDAPTEFVHTLNGSGLAVGRTIAAIIENYQNEDGSVSIPEILIPYMNGIKIIK